MELLQAMKQTYPLRKIFVITYFNIKVVEPIFPISWTDIIYFISNLSFISIITHFSFQTFDFIDEVIHKIQKCLKLECNDLDIFQSLVHLIRIPLSRTFWENAFYDLVNGLPGRDS